jgi:DNA-directed RNA polymerase specialized sigma24 family protein
LFTIARNQFLDLLRKKKRQPVRNGSSSILDLLERHPSPDDVSDQLAAEHRRELFRWAAARVKTTVKEATWRAFWMTSVADHSIEDAAQTLGLTVGAVYIARSRVLTRLRDEIRQLENDHAL